MSGDNEMVIEQILHYYNYQVVMSTWVMHMSSFTHFTAFFTGSSYSQKGSDGLESSYRR